MSQTHVRRLTRPQFIILDHRYWLAGLVGLGGLGVVLTLAGSSALQAQTQPVAAPMLSSTPRFVERTGPEIYANVCQACHMVDGKGAKGAALYPSLVGNKNLEARGYPISVVVNGLRGMPQFGTMMSDEQVVEIVNYVRMHFGNSYGDAATLEEAKSARR